MRTIPEIAAAAMKKVHESAILCFHVGDFYECYGRHAKDACDSCGNLLTYRGKLPMFGGIWDHEYDREKDFAKMILAGFVILLYERQKDSQLDAYENTKILR